MSAHKITALRTGFANGMDWESEHEITFSYRKGSPDYWNKHVGTWEQGYGPELEVVSIKPDAGDHGAFTDLAQRGLEDWAQDWLDTDGYDQALEVVASDMEAAREYAAEDRHNDWAELADSSMPVLSSRAA